MAESITRESYSATGLPGATQGTRYVGATVSGAPTSGTYVAGDFLIGQNGNTWVCTSPGSPGTWVPGAQINLSYTAGSGTVVTTATTSSGLGVVRNIWVVSGTVTPSGGANGDIWIQYS